MKLRSHYAEVISSGAGKLRTDSLYAEVISSGAGKLRTDSLYAEVILTPYTPPKINPYVQILY